MKNVHQLTISIHDISSGIYKISRTSFRYINRYWKGVSYKYLYNIYIYICKYNISGIKIKFQVN